MQLIMMLWMLAFLSAFSLHVWRHATDFSELVVYTERYHKKRLYALGRLAYALRYYHMTAALQAQIESEGMVKLDDILFRSFSPTIIMIEVTADGYTVSHCFNK